jgi:hypothetical protein
MKAEIKTQKVKFVMSGESPDFGVYTAGEERELSGKLLKDFLKRGIVEKPTKEKGVKNGG